MLRLVVFLFFIVGTLQVQAQRTQYFQDPFQALRYGKELMEREKYAAAKSHFEAVIQMEFPKADLNQQKWAVQEARYFVAVAGVELRQPDADHRLLQFIELYPQDVRTDEAKFYLGRYYFEAKRYRDVIEVFKSTAPDYLSAAQSAAFHYYFGYSYFSKDSFELARIEFEQISGLKNEYHYPANYYLGFIAYSANDHENALKYFLKLTESKYYNRIVPYYIAKLYFDQGDYNKLLDYTLALAGNKEVKQQASINYLIAQTYFKQEAFIKAVPYMNRYLELSGNGTQNDYYQLGFALYQARDYGGAVPHLSKNASRKDTIGQNASFLLGDIYLKTGQKEKALSSFYAASKMDYDVEIKEQAAFNHAKLGFELNIHPQSLNWLRDFVQTYPQSKFSDEARTLLGDLLLSTKNFKEAVLVIEGVKERNLAINKSYQKVTFFRGIELFNQGVWGEAALLFDKSLTQAIDKNITAQSYYWRAESLFKLNRLKDAIADYQRFVQAWAATTGLEVENSLITAYYGLGYCYFKQNDFLSAVSNFERSYKAVLESDKKVQMNMFTAALFSDVVLRLGDAHFALNNYPDALSYYQQAIDRKAVGGDYALFQKSIVLGLTNQTDKKIESIRKFLVDFPSSLYFDNALLELANTYFLRENYEQANMALDRMIKDRPGSLLLKNAYLIKGLMFFNQEKFDLAITNYKKVVELFPKTNEARDALNGIRNIYILQNDVEAYFAYANKIPSANVTLSAQDSITFQAVELVYNAGDCIKAVTELSRYIDKFPDGFFAVQARYLRADCHEKNGNLTEMELDLKQVVIQPRNLYTERSQAKLGRFYLNANQLEKAIEQWEGIERLADSRWNIREAYLSLMRAWHKLEDTVKAANYAAKLKSYAYSTEQDKLEADLVNGEVLLKKNELTAALLQFTGIYEATKNELGARAKYGIAVIQLQRKEWNQAQATVFELVDKIPYYDEWVAKSFLILAETYVGQSDYFQAKATLQSIIDNRDEDEITKKAAARIEEITKIEKENLENSKNKANSEGGENNEN